MPYHVYILAAKRNGTLYTGVTNDLRRRVREHKEKLLPGFTARYSVSLLVYFEETNDVLPPLRVKSRLRAGAGKEKFLLSKA